MSMFWQYFVSNGQGGQNCPQLGVHGHGVPLPRSVNQRFGLLQGTGVEIWAIKPGSPADRAGLRLDDIILAVGVEPTTNMGNLNKVLRTPPMGKFIPVIVLREEQLEERVVVNDDNPRKIGRL